MPSTSSPRVSTINLPRMILWLASIVLAAGGVFLTIQSNTKEAAIYASGTADYPKLFMYQSGSTLGGSLIAVGVLGALLALVSLAVTWRAGAATVVPADGADAFDATDADPDDFDDEAEPVEAPVVAPVAEAPVR